MRLAAYILAVAVLFSVLGPSPLNAKYVCGVFEGTFTCRYESTGKPKVKGAIPGKREDSPAIAPGEQVAPAPGNWDTQNAPAGTPAPEGTGCQHGMAGTPPNCRCPPNSELLGGNCVRYTASTCSNGLTADAMPQACRGVEEKLSCRMRDDGLKDCCCITYDKF
jgi:hypothetical protein